MSTQDIADKITKSISHFPYGGAIRRIGVFGSQASGTARPESDIDLLVEFDPSTPIGLFELVALKKQLEAALNHPVDLLTPDSISHYLKTDIERHTKIIYERP